MSPEAPDAAGRELAEPSTARVRARRSAASVTLALGGLVSLAAAVGIGRFVYTPILPVMAEGAGLSAGQAGLVASANFLGYLTGALLAAAPRLPGSRRAWLLGALAASAATTGAMGLASSMPVFLALRFAGGVASAFVLVFASVLVLDRLAAAGRGGLSALHFAGVGVGIALSAAIVSGLLAAGAGWRALWLASAAASLAAVLAVSRLVPDEPGAQSGSAPAAGGAPAGAARHGLSALVAAYGLFGFGYVITATFLVAIVRDAPETRAVEPLVWIVAGLASTPSVALWTRMGDRLGIPLAFAAACLAEAAGVAASVLWTDVSGVLFAAASLGGTFMGITALGLVGARRLSGSDPRRTLALMTAAFGLGQIAGPAFAGFVHDRTGSFVPSSLAATCTLVAAAVLAARVRMPG
jgi:predicted MFS family arabinose efflux permease